MDEQDGKHVFVSYVREDSDEVDGLCAVLEAARIPYWRDRSALGPGDAWKAKIRQAIREGSLVFLGCFSDNSRAKEKSYMNEELTIAVEEFRQMPPGRTWLIPVRFDAGEVPEWDLGAGRLLSDLNYSNLFGKQYAAEAASLVTTIHRLNGDKHMDAASALAAVEQATAADRSDLLRRLTKEMLLDPARRIELDDLVTQEVHRLSTALADPSLVTGPLGPDSVARVTIAERADQMWTLTAPFCASLQVAGRWGPPEGLTPWVSGLRSFVSAATKMQAGIDLLLSLRHLPGVASILVSALACGSSSNWEGLKLLAVDPTVRSQHDGIPMALLDATDPYRLFGSDERTANLVARAAILGRDHAEVLDELTKGQLQHFYDPTAEWLHHIIRPLFADQWPDDDVFDAEWDRAEVVLGVLAQDLVNLRTAAHPERSWIAHCRWFGRSTWRAGHYRNNALADVLHEYNNHGARWKPLQAGLFGGDQDRAEAALTRYAEQFNEISSRRF